MNSKRLHLILLAVICLLIAGLVAGAYGVNSLLGSESNKLVALKAKDQALGQEQLGLVKAKGDIKKYTYLEQIAKTVVPEDKSQAEAVREIVNIAAANSISLGAINFPASTLGSTASGAPTVKQPSTSGSAATSGGNKKSLSQLQPVKSISGVYQLVITVNSDANQPVPYSKFIDFLSSLEHNRRTAQVSAITIQPDSKDRTRLSFTLSINEYIKP